MTALVFPRSPALPDRDRLVAIGAGGVMLLVAAALVRHLASGMPLFGRISPWLVLHLATVLPAVPIGGWLLVRRAKGDRLHRMLGKVWCVLMMVGALSSFGLTGMFGRIGPIHILSAMVIVGVPRAIRFAMRGNIRLHRRGMTIMVASSVVAGLLAFLPGRVLGMWLLG